MILAQRLMRALHAPAPELVLLAGDGHEWGDVAKAPVDAAVLVPVTDRPDPGVILTQRTETLSRHPGQIAFPGGRVDPGDADTIAAALREAEEEIGLPRDQVTIVGPADRYRTITGFHIVPVAAFTAPPERFIPDAGEVAEVFEVPFAHLMDPANHERLHREMPPGPPRWYWAIPWNDKLIWGATAGMVRGLYERLEAAHAERA